MDNKILGKKLRVGREKCGLTQEAVERVLGLPEKSITRIESGARRVSTLELTQLAALYHKPIGDFLVDDTMDEDLLVALCRLAPGLEANAKINEQIARCIHICREGVALEKILGIFNRQCVLSYPFPSPKNSEEAIEQGEHVAREERRRLGLANSPIYDIVELLFSQRIWSAGTELLPHMSGLFLHHPLLGMAIFVNSRHVRARQRFSYAHEYAHALFDQNRHVLISAADNASALIEMRANAFAAAFLLPKEGVSDIIKSLGKGYSSRHQQAVFDAATEGVVETEKRRSASDQRITPQDVAYIAHHFGVSYQAMLYRLHSLSHISSSGRDDLFKKESIGRDYLRMLDLLQDLEKSEKSSLQQRELKADVSRLIIEAYRRGEISRGRLFELSKLLNLPGEKLLEMVGTESEG